MSLERTVDIRLMLPLCFSAKARRLLTGANPNLGGGGGSETDRGGGEGDIIEPGWVSRLTELQGAVQAHHCSAASLFRSEQLSSVSRRRAAVIQWHRETPPLVIRMGHFLQMFEDFQSLGIKSVFVIVLLNVVCVQVQETTSQPCTAWMWLTCRGGRRPCWPLHCRSWRI